MELVNWLVIFIPIYIIFLVLLPQQDRVMKVVRNRKGRIKMTNELLKSYIGKVCTITTGSFGSTVKGKIIHVENNWIEVETKKGKQLINADFVLNLVEMP